MPYEPPFEITPDISTVALEIAEMVGSLSSASDLAASPTLHRRLRIQTIHSSLAIEQNTLTEEQVTAVLEGKRVLGPPDDIREVENAKRAYDLMNELNPFSLDDLLRAHGTMMEGLAKDAGRFRSKNAGVYDERGVLVHAGTPATYVPGVMSDVFAWLKGTEVPPLIASCVFHYEFEFVHPFSDGNGRTGRLWHTLLLARWRPVLAWLPVESMIRQRQGGYYAALNASNADGASTRFIAFMLRAIRDAIAPYCASADPSRRLRLAVMDAFEEDPHATVDDVAERIGASKRTVERAIASLKDEGRVRRIGSPRAGHWEVERT